jgi:hypothetical protein
MHQKIYIVDDNFVVNKIKDLMAIQGEIGLTVKIGLFSGLREDEIIYIHNTEMCNNLGGCNCIKLHVIDKSNGVTIIVINWFRAHKPIYPEEPAHKPLTCINIIQKPTIRMTYTGRIKAMNNIYDESTITIPPKMSMVRLVV